MSWDEQIRKQLDTLRNKLLLLRLEEGFWRWAGILLILFLAVAVAEWLLQLSPAVRLPLLVAALGIAVLYFVISLAYPLIKHFAAPQSYEVLALRWGHTLAGVNDRLLNSIQVYEKRGVENTSPELAELALSTIARELDGASYAGALDREIVKSSRRSTILVVGLWAVTLLAAQGQFTNALQRVFQPTYDFSPPPPFALTLTNLPDFTIRGEPLTAKVQVTGVLPDDLEVIFLQPGTDALRLSASFDTSGVAVCTLENPQFDLKIFAQSDDIFSDTASVEVKSRPFISELRLRWFPPAYSGLESGSSVGRKGDVTALKGSRLRVAFSSDRDIQSAELIVFNDSNPQQPHKRIMEVQGKEASTEFLLMKSGHYNIVFSDEDGIANAEPVDYSLWPLLDEYPAIGIFYPPPEAEFNESLLVPVKVGARDDYAVKNIRIGRYLHKGGMIDTSRSIDFQWRDVPFQKFGDGTALVDLLMDFTEMDLLPGDILDYKFEAWDNDEISGPKRAETPIQRLRFPTMGEIFARMENNFDEQVDDVEDVLDRTLMLKEELDALQEELKRNPDLSWEEKQNVEDLLQKQEELAKQVEQMSEQVDKMLQKLEENKMLSPETMQKYMELQQMMSEIMTPELQEAMQKLQEALLQKDPEQLRRAVEEFSFNQEEFTEKMEKMLNILEQLKQEMMLDELAKRAEKLLEKQEDINKALSDSSAQADPQELAQAEKELKQEMQAFEQAFQEAQQELQDSPFNPKEQMDAAQELMDETQFPQEMGEMSEQMQQGNKSEAQKKGSKLQSGLAQLNQMMQQAKKDMISQSKQELADALRRVAHDLLNLSFQQEELLDESSDLDRASPQFRELAQDQQLLKNHLEKTAEDLFELSQQSFFITPQIGQAMEQAFQGMDQALQGYTARAPRSVTRQQQTAMGGMNQTVMQIGNALDQMSSSSSSTGFQEMMEQLSQMAGQQGDINQGTMSLMPGGANPGSMSLQQQAAMSRMAVQQEALRRQMDEWADQNQEASQMLGRLDELGKEMQEIVDDLKNRQVDERTLKRQEQVLRRLLDAQKSVREREHRKER
ncbi:hypothetical protein KKA00_02280, partial [bacterium]|nr:hypothetical protein [bacterium]